MPLDSRSGRRSTAGSHRRVPRASRSSGPPLPRRATGSGAPRARALRGQRARPRGPHVDLPVQRSVRGLRGVLPLARAAPGERGPTVLRVRRGRERPCGGPRFLPAHRPGKRRDRGGAPGVLAPAAGHDRSHRGDVPDDAPGVRPRLPALRVEVRCAECGLAPRRRAPRVHFRGYLPAGGRLQRPQPRHRVVLDRRWRVAGPRAGLPRVARPDNFDQHGRQRRSLAQCREECR